MSTDEIAMVRTIERMIGQQIPRISVPGYDFGTTAENGSTGDATEPVTAEINASIDPVATQRRYRRPSSVARRR
jgi:hypothetical protein